MSDIDPEYWTVITVPGMDLPESYDGRWFSFKDMTSMESVFDRDIEIVASPTPMVVYREDGATARVFIAGRRENLRPQLRS